MAKAEKRNVKEQERALAPRRLSDLSRWEREMDRWFEDFFSPRWSLFRPGSLFPWRREISVPMVNVDVYEDKDEVVTKAELPGLTKDQISVSISDHLLTIKGEKKKEEDIEEENYRYSERAYGSFARTIELPAEVQADKAKASFKDGVLEIRVPKSEEAKRKQISINVE